MAKYLLPHFPTLDTSTLDEYYDVDIDFNGKKIQIDLNFERKSIDIKRMDKVKEFIEKLADYDKENKIYIDQDYKDKDCDTVKTYIDYHIEEIEKDDLSHLIDFNDELTSPETQLIRKLHLVRMGLYPDSIEDFAVFDYSVDKELTDQLVVIKTDENGKFDYMTMES